MPRVIGLGDATAVALAGGKAAALGELIRLGERVPAGFCVTTDAYRDGVVPRAAVRAAYDELGGGSVAVRSSATAEDQPDASFAGQYASFLDVTGPDAVIAAIEKCWASLRAPRAEAYRRAHGLGDVPGEMAVVVQRMVGATTAGVLFTANVRTGRRTEMLVEAATGAGPAVVDGGRDVDRYVLDAAAGPELGWLGELRAAGERLQRHFGAPQDVEWALDEAGALWLLQSRPITTLFPLPPDDGRPGPRVYLEFGHVQGMVRPVTPLGLSTLRKLIGAMLAPLGIRAEVVDVGGRLYGDLTDMVRSPVLRKRLVAALAVDFGPRAQAAMQHVLNDPRFAPSSDMARPGRTRGARVPVWRAASGILGALARPDAAHRRVAGAVDRLRLAAEPPPGLRTTADRLRFVEREDDAGGRSAVGDDLTWPIVAGMLASALPGRLLAGVASPAGIQAALAGMPDNVTIEMDLALWRLAERARPLLLDLPAGEMAARYRAGTLPDIGMTGFLARYGHRGAAEVDLGVPRWSEDPAPVFAAVANYLRATDPEQAPDRRFARAAAGAETALRELITTARRRRPVRALLAGFLLRRARRLAGLREAGKFAGLYRLQAMREQLLVIGRDLAGDGRLAAPGDIVFLTLDEVRTAVTDRADHRATVAARRLRYERELRRRTVPVALLSDGTDVEALLDALPDGTLTGVGAAAGRATGPARIVDDPATAHIEPGEVLVVATTDPGWTPLFLTAAALVTETGAVMAHGPTVAREYGIPAVIAVPGATTRIANGRLITVDGAAGTVTFA